jgi:hypothetical protein
VGLRAGLDDVEKRKAWQTAITFPVVLYACESWSLTVREEPGLRIP